MELIIKQCVVCDTILSEPHEYMTNHYLCGNGCADFYSHISLWNGANFSPNIIELNIYRLKVLGIKELTQEDLDNRKD